MWHHYNTLNGSTLTGLTCCKVTGFWTVEHQLVFSVVRMNSISAHVVPADTKAFYNYIVFTESGW